MCCVWHVGLDNVLHILIYKCVCIYMYICTYASFIFFYKFLAYLLWCKCVTEDQHALTSEVNALESVSFWLNNLMRLSSFDKGLNPKAFWCGRASGKLAMRQVQGPARKPSQRGAGWTLACWQGSSGSHLSRKHSSEQTRKALAMLFSAVWVQLTQLH